MDELTSVDNLQRQTRVRDQVTLPEKVSQDVESVATNGKGAVARDVVRTRLKDRLVTEPVRVRMVGTHVVPVGFEIAKDDEELVVVDGPPRIIQFLLDQAEVVGGQVPPANAATGAIVPTRIAYDAAMDLWRLVAKLARPKIGECFFAERFRTDVRIDQIGLKTGNGSTPFGVIKVHSGRSKQALRGLNWANRAC